MKCCIQLAEQVETDEAGMTLLVQSFTDNCKLLKVAEMQLIEAETGAAIAEMVK